MKDFEAIGMTASGKVQKHKLREHRILTAPDLDAALAECRVHLARPDVVFSLYTTVQVWGRVP